MQNPNDSGRLNIRLAVLASPAFVVALLALLVNDFILKAQLHGWFTGKLSDFAGLFVFASLVLALLPDRSRSVLAGTAIFFAWWKSPLSQPAIDFVSAYLHLALHRVVDYSDLLAVAVLPLAWLNFIQWRTRKASRFVMYPAGIAALAAVTATSMAPTYTSGDVHLVDTQPDSITHLYADIDALTAEQGFIPTSNYGPGDKNRTYRRPESKTGPRQTLYVDYDPETATLYYAYPESGHDKEGVARYQAALLLGLSARHPGLTIQQRGADFPARRSGFFRVTMTFPSHAGLFNTCDNSGSNNRDLSTSYEVLDELARENGLMRGPPDPLDRTTGYGYCLKGDLRYHGGRVTDALGTLSLNVDEHMQFEVFGTGTTVYTDIWYCCEDRDQARAEAFTNELHERLQVQHWQDSDVELDPIEGK